MSSGSNVVQTLNVGSNWPKVKHSGSLPRERNILPYTAVFVSQHFKRYFTNYKPILSMFSMFGTLILRYSQQNINKLTIIVLRAWTSHLLTPVAWSQNLSNSKEYFASYSKMLDLSSAHACHMVKYWYLRTRLLLFRSQNSQILRNPWSAVLHLESLSLS